jgi:hypothetical protein
MNENILNIVGTQFYIGKIDNIFQKKNWLCRIKYQIKHFFL